MYPFPRKKKQAKKWRVKCFIKLVNFNAHAFEIPYVDSLNIVNKCCDVARI